MKGVYKTRNGKWQVFIWPDGKARYVGTFESEAQAKQAKNDALEMWLSELRKKEGFLERQLFEKIKNGP